MKIEDMKVTVDREAVFRMIDCREDSPVYEEMTEAYESLLPEILDMAEGRCVFGSGEITGADASKDCPAGTKALYVISTVGQRLSSLESELFAEGDYVRGMLADAMADACLFSLEEGWQEAIKQFCAEHGYGIEKRLEAPNGLPMSVQKTAFTCLNAGQELDMKISSGYMYDPVKSACYVLVLSDNPELFRAQHDCRRCTRLDCKVRKAGPALVTICSQEGKRQVFCEEGESILAAYRRQGGSVSAVCGGKGSCGKCKIRLVSGNLAITPADRELFGESGLREGYRLSCLAYPRTDCVVELCFQDETGFQAVDQFLLREDRHKGNGSGHNLGIAIDIGTTTMAAQLVELESGEILATCSAVNRQRAYGADVISRIEAANSGNGVGLQKLVRTDLASMTARLLEQAKVEAADVKRMVIAGNTTMGHLLMGYPCDTLGVYPFTPVNIDVIRDSSQNMTGFGEVDCETILLPGISTFVGGDIVSGLYACGFTESDEVNLLVDLGTNGEMAIGSREKLLVTSTAAGPAFEGGNISCGAGSIPGAICHVHIDSDGKAGYDTIGDQPPVGICGTGVIEMMAELLRQELIDETGLLEDPYFEDGFPLAETLDGTAIRFTQKDVREVQLAKAAVRAGVETLMKRYGITSREIAHVYLAGGFGFQMDREAAVTVGLFPEALKEKITAVGNSSLAGAVRTLTDPDWERRQRKLIENAAEVELSKDAVFNECYMTYMIFGEDEI